MSIDPAAALKARLRADLVDAMKGRRADDVALLRTLLAAIDDAEAPEVGAQPNRGETTEIARLVLTAAELRAVVHREVEARETAAAEFTALGQPDRAAVLRAQAALAGRYLADLPA